MNIRKVSFVSLVFLLSTSIIHPMWMSKMGDDSQKFLGSLEQVVKQVNQKYPGFYDVDKEREIVKKEFSREYLNSYARSIAEHMKYITCEVRPIVGKYRFFVIKEFIEFLKLIGEYDQFDMLSKCERKCFYGQFIDLFINRVRDYRHVKDITGHQRKFEGKEESYEDEQTQYYQYYSEQAKDIARRGLFKLFKIICKGDEQKLGLLKKCFGKKGENLNYETISTLAESQDLDVKNFINKFFEKGTEQFLVIIFVKNEKGYLKPKDDILAEPDVWVLKPDVIKGIVNDCYFPPCTSLQVLEDFVSQNKRYLSGYELILTDTVEDQKITGLRLWTTDSLDKGLRDKIAKRIGTELFVCKKLFSALCVDIDYNPRIRVSMRDLYKYAGPEKKNKKIIVNLWERGYLDIHLLPTACKKIFPERNKIFRAVHANSATNFSMSNLLIVFRKEEIAKTSLHEMNHQIGVGSDNFTRWLGQNFAIEKVGGSDSFGNSFFMDEIVAESVACITNAIMTAYDIDPDNFFEIAFQMLEREKLFSIYQAAKILYLSGFDNFEQFYNSKKNGPRVKQVAAVAEYHILKAAAINNSNGFLGIFMNPENKDMYTGDQKRKLEEERGEIIVDTGKVRRNNRLKYHVLRNMRVCMSFKNKVNTLLQAFNEGIIPCTHDDDLFATGRMTVIESR